ncbi:MAG TPA: nitroreductase family protein [Pyrinomonadaceae bacterium]|nr:nitroreductase family protein [Pyrinomonadaceae bacterium]
MINGSQVRKAGHPVDKLFLNRWSPRALSGEAVSEEELMTLFEAARWAPSSYNNQPWRLLYARRDTEHWPVFLNLLVEGNRAWAKDAAALVLFVSKETFDFNGQPYPTHSFDTGAAWASLALQATLMGLVTHGMQGFDYERARAELNVPEGFRVEAMAAIGRPGDPAKLPEKMREREHPSDRKPLSAVTCEGPFNF